MTDPATSISTAIPEIKDGTSLLSDGPQSADLETGANSFSTYTLHIRGAAYNLLTQMSNELEAPLKEVILDMFAHYWNAMQEAKTGSRPDQTFASASTDLLERFRQTHAAPKQPAPTVVVSAPNRTP